VMFPILAREIINMRDTLNGTLDLLTRKIDLGMDKLSSGLERKAQGTIFCQLLVTSPLIN